jgi:hypothetical protein
MKALLVFCCTLLFAAAAVAGPCAVLDYQEMKDMPVEDLAKEACKAHKAMADNLDDNIQNLGPRSGPAPFPNASDNFDQCKGQSDRIERVLLSRGVTKQSLASTCKANTADKTRSTLQAQPSK